MRKSDHGNGYLLDGYPRTIDQARAFDELVAGSDLEIDKVLFMGILSMFWLSVLQAAAYVRNAVRFITYKQAKSKRRGL